MANMQFEWDKAKRVSTIAKHGVDFEDAKLNSSTGGQCCMHLRITKVRTDGSRRRPERSARFGGLHAPERENPDHHCPPRKERRKEALQ